MKKFITLLLAAVLCFTCLAGCGNVDVDTQPQSKLEADPDFVWTNEYGISYDVSKLNYANYDIASLFDENGLMVGIKAADYVTLPGDYQAISVPHSEIRMTAEQQEEAIASLMASYATVTQITDRAVLEGDKVNIDYVGSVDGVEFVGGNTQGAGADVTAGSQEYVDDFLTQIIGVKPGETVDVVVTFPADYGDSTDTEGNAMTLSGKEAVFVTTVNYIHGETNTPELTDEWVKETLYETTGFATKDELLEDMFAYYEDENKYTWLRDYLLENSTFADELPKSLYTYVGEYMLYAQSYYGASLGGDLAGYLQLQGYKSVEDYLDKNAEMIDKDVKYYLVMQALMEEMDVIMTADEVKTLFGEEAYNQYVTSFGENYTVMYASGATCLNEVAAGATIVED